MTVIYLMMSRCYLFLTSSRCRVGHHSRHGIEGRRPEAFGHVTDALLQGQQLLVRHVVDVEVGPHRLLLHGLLLYDTHEAHEVHHWGTPMRPATPTTAVPASSHPFSAPFPCWRCKESTGATGT